MAASQRLLALFLGALPFVIGCCFSVFLELELVNDGLTKQQKMVCAHERLGTAGQSWTIRWEAFVKGQNPFEDLSPVPIEKREISLKKLGCSDSEYDTVTFGDARNPPTLNWSSLFAPSAALGMAITLITSLGVYRLVRAAYQTGRSLSGL
jgi:hypothetical protein